MFSIPPIISKEIKVLQQFDSLSYSDTKILGLYTCVVYFIDQSLEHYSVSCPLMQIILFYYQFQEPECDETRHSAFRKAAEILGEIG